jgi:hypothetical protein
MPGATRKADGFWRVGWLTAMAAGLLLSMGGCGSSDDHSASAGAASAAHKTKGKTAAPAGKGGLALGDMVAAVTLSKPGPPIELKFSLPSRPEVGQVMEVEVAVIPRAPIPDSVSVSFQAVEGLEVVDGAQLERVEKLVDGVPIRHILKILPKRDGIFALTAVASFVSAGQDANRTFSIPLIAAQGLPEQVAKGP